MIERRTWLVGALALLAAPMVAGAQAPAKSFRIGLLSGSSRTSPEASHIWASFFQGLRELGYVEGQNVVIEGRFSGDSVDRLPALAAELVRLPVDVIVAGAPPGARDGQAGHLDDPDRRGESPHSVGTGLVASLARPGANVTGLSLLSSDLRIKQLQLLKEAVPRLGTVAVLWNPAIPSAYVRELELAARPLKVRLRVATAKAPSEFAEAFSVMARERAGGVIILASPMFFAHGARLAELAARNRLPSMFLFREYAEAGGLMTYGVDLRDNFRRAAGYVDRILKGAAPGDLPIEQPTKFELVINLRAAKALGLTIPRALLARADQVIE